jgi:hypothetical protein
MNGMMNPMVAALLGRQQQPGMGGMGGMPGQGMAPPTGIAPPVGQAPTPQLTMAALNGMNKNDLPNDWINKLSPEERYSIMPQWSNG